MNGTSKGSSRWHFPCWPQQRISDLPVKHTARGERHHISHTATPLALGLPVDNILKVSFLTATEQFCDREPSLFITATEHLWKLAPFGCLNNCSGFELVAFWQQALVSYYQFTSHSAHLNTCTLAKQVNVNDCESPSDRDVTFTCVRHTVGYSRAEGKLIPTASSSCWFQKHSVAPDPCCPLLPFTCTLILENKGDA